MQNINFSAVVQYFETLARQHTSILHSDTRKAFFRLELDEVVEGLRNNICFPVIILEGYDLNFKDNKSDNLVKQRGSAFVIVDKARRGDFDAIHEVYDRMEQIGDDVLTRMRHDKFLRQSPVRDFDLNNVDGSLIGWPIDSNLYGIRYTFTIDSAFPSDIDPDRWNITPIE